MIKITIYRSSDHYMGFRSAGHAGYAEEGQDIICAAVSVLIVNTINSIEAFTEDHFHVSQKEGLVELKFEGTVSHDTTLLMDSLILGLQAVQTDYNDGYIHIIFKEV